MDTKLIDTDVEITPHGGVQPAVLGIEVVWTGHGVVVFGPTSRAQRVACADVELLTTARLDPSVSLASVSTHELTDRVVPAADVGLDLPVVADPTSAAALLARAARDDLLVRDHAVSLVLAGCTLGESRRSTERRFRRVVGMPPAAAARRQRAAEAKRRLMAGIRPTVVADVLGYSDHSHLVRDCRELLGAVPSQVASG